MKVAMYNVTTNVVKGGIETFCIGASEEMVRRGIDVRIVCGTDGKIPETFEKNGVKYHAFPYRRREEFPDIGSRFRKLCKRISFARNCMDFLLEEKFDIVHVHKPFEFPIMYYLRKKGNRSKIVYGANGADFFMTDRFFFKRVVDASIACSIFNGNEVKQRYGIQPGIIYNGADEKLFRPMDMSEARKSCGLKPDIPYIGTIGRLVGWKGIQVLLKAMPRILEECPETTLLIIGGGDYKFELDLLAEKLGIGDNVLFAGRIEHEKLPLWVNAMDIAMQPSVGDEGFSLTVIEAMSCGKPVIGTPSGGTPEILTDGEVGFIVPKHDDKLLAERTITLIKDRDLTAAMGKKARQRVLERFTWEKVVPGLIGVYERVLDGHTVVP